MYLGSICIFSNVDSCASASNAIEKEFTFVIPISMINILSQLSSDILLPDRSPSGMLIYTINALDSDDLSVRYELTGDSLFRINGNTGNIFTTGIVDKSLASSYELTICIFSEAETCIDAQNAKEITLSIAIHSVIDITFILSAEIRVLRDSSSDTVVLDVNANDSAGLSIHYELNGTNLFTIDSISGEITTTVVINQNDGLLDSATICVYSDGISCGTAINPVRRDVSFVIVSAMINVVSEPPSLLRLNSSADFGGTWADGYLIGDQVFDFSIFFRFTEGETCYEILGEGALTFAPFSFTSQ